MRHTIVAWWVLAAAVMCVPRAADAQTPAAETFEPQAAASTSIWSTATSQVLPHLVPGIRLVGHYADDPVELNRADTSEPVARLIDDQYKLDVGLAVGVFDRVELGVVLPVVVYQSGTSARGLPAPNQLDLADARAHLRASLWQGDHGGVGAQVTGYLPTAAASPYQSRDALGALAMLVADYHAGGPHRWQVAANLGWAFEPSRRDAVLATDDRLEARLGGQIQVVGQTLALMAEGFGRWEAQAGPRESVSAGYLAGARLRWGNTGLASTIGAGGALAGGYGEPDWRALASLSYAPSGRPTSSPNDPSHAGCPGGREDHDGFEDDDGCADPDNDQDGIADVDDQCPNRPEDADRFDDADGCPDPDNDQDGITDFNDACPDRRGTADTAGCPFVDEDNDGIDASVDQCPDQPEDVDGFDDTDGCPDPDNDQDGIADADDQCPDVAESINGVNDQDGCPDAGKSAVRLTGESIEILERVHFDTNRATIKADSHSLLEQVAAVLQAHPDIKALRIQGHTDARGDAQDNLELSQQRAVSVKEFLVDQGIDAGRLSARGYGETHPLADNATADGRAQNRRVEFHIVQASRQ